MHNIIYSIGSNVILLVGRCRLGTIHTTTKKHYSVGIASTTVGLHTALKSTSFYIRTFIYLEWTISLILLGHSGPSMEPSRL